jgi:hypothetical protein
MYANSNSILTKNSYLNFLIHLKKQQYKLQEFAPTSPSVSLISKCGEHQDRGATPDF